MNPTLDLGSWCILRMAGGSTLPLVRSLNRAGIEAWAPVERRAAKMPRTGAAFDKEIALLPSYVFAAVGHVDELLSLEHSPKRAHPKFFVFRHNNGVPLVADDQLDALRSEEARKVRVFDKWRRRVTKGQKLERGTMVKMPDGPFQGFSGIVEDHQGQFTVVATSIFGKPVEIKVASCLLVDDVAYRQAPRQFAA